jgi:hypothetical protein
MKKGGRGICPHSPCTTIYYRDYDTIIQQKSVKMFN